MEIQKTERPMTTGERAGLIAKTSDVFSPAAPINRRDLFAGRLKQLERVFDAVSTRGQHAVIFGERGVGKTSLANIVQDIAGSQYADATVVKVNCSQDDDFTSVWRKALGEVTFEYESDGIGFKAEPIEESERASKSLAENPTPNDVRRVLKTIGRSIIIFDEFDRVKSGQGLFADTIKTLSDTSSATTLVVVGVAHDIDGLIAEHASIDRALVQILMPRMSLSELHEILNKAMESLTMTMNSDARSLIVLLSQGLPHYTHVLGKASAIQAINSGRWEIGIEDVHAGISSALREYRAEHQECVPRSDWQSPARHSVSSGASCMCAC